MPRYDNGKDWVEIAGVAHLPMRELMIMDAPSAEVAHEFMLSVTKQAHFVAFDESVVDWRTDVYGLTAQQWQWWKLMVWAAAREEKIGPEA